ncbi:hypothetical protein HRR83_000977 [Exophiala dermatitidis]|uniref:amidase n=2 Tax=Exophiala dermatitidis TaxID=5970 RepID=H6CBS0_EXODN|nr:amidase [Exophiala dermatitidis NIH/UT8656]KAJ4525298.1 hypothetical protein HRR75_000889 [Exophiala dermatitidis]EHY61217.1 amidase [Exophiala dermatitidis NIH/UT8656]KAJ4528226.1 hypothetical protein HRR74_000981 [Exophiala dermatitidis]KAJ4528859.1 hypothetical protein HRR73_001482 [Exophiala dermatitidis]KAJ4530250.1 hypothetical protein HRR76_009478 [Exophiala dermatitidis]
MASSSISGSRDPYHVIAARKQEARSKLIPKEWLIPETKLHEYTSSPTANVLHVPAKSGLLSSRELEITENYDAVGLLEMLRKGPADGGYSVTEVVTAFCKRAAIAQQLTNCLTEIMFESALQRAKKLDDDCSANPTQTFPPLWGLPISLKDSFNIPGFDATIGLVHFAEKPCSEYSALPKLFLDLGAVFYCKTNVPQTMMTADSDNNIFGRTMNPHNRSLTAGGSSGGEGALIAMRGSIVGIGTDIAGSIRIPSHCCGIYGFKPSANIVPYAGQQSPAAAGLPGIQPVAGPMATSLRSCELIMRTIMSNQPWKVDVECLHIPWRGLQAPNGGKLRIGVIEDDGLFTPTPPMRRALAEAKTKLQKAGMEIVAIKLPNVARDIGIIWASFSLEGSKTVLEYISSANEPFVESVKRVGLVSMPPKSLQDLFAWNVARREAATAYKDLWLENNLDAILNTLAPHTAPPLDTWPGITQALWNLVDYPSCIIPTGKVGPGDVTDNAAKYGPDDEKVYAMYTGPDNYQGAPTTLQLVGMRQEDENLVAMAGIVDKILNNS